MPTQTNATWAGLRYTTLPLRKPGRVMTREPIHPTVAGRGRRHRVKARLSGALKTSVFRATHTLRLRQSDASLERASQRYWSRYWGSARGMHTANDGHWRGYGPFVDDERWMEIGRSNLQRYVEMKTAIGFADHVERIVEWGVGGGANAVHFAQLCDRFVGVDVASASLDESAKQLKADGFQNFEPVLVDVAYPEAARATIGVCDLFLCLYVYELLPTPEYGERVLRIAFDLLRPGGTAFIQVKYQDDSSRSRARRLAYSLNMTNMTSYRIETFWRMAADCGFEPELVKLVPWDEVVEDERYAYFLLRKPSRHQQDELKT